MAKKIILGIVLIILFALFSFWYIKGYGIQVPVWKHNGELIVMQYICYGDLCPNNSGWHLKYSNNDVDCKALGGTEIIRFSGWGDRLYGCEPW